MPLLFFITCMLITIVIINFYTKQKSYTRLHFPDATIQAKKYFIESYSLHIPQILKKMFLLFNLSEKAQRPGISYYNACKVKCLFHLFYNINFKSYL